VNRRGILRSAFAATAAAVGLDRFAAPTQAQTKHIRLYVEMEVAAAREREATLIVVGLPLTLQGTIGPAARFADEYNTVMATPEECAERREKLARACEREGREPIPLSLMTGCAIGRDEAEARERIRRRLERAGQQIDPDEYKAQRGAAAILGTLEEAAERLRAYERAGVERVMLQHLDHQDLEMVELIGRELVPAVA